MEKCYFYNGDRVCLCVSWGMKLIFIYSNIN